MNYSYVTINTPKSFDLSQLNLSKSKIEKAKFLIHQINFFTKRYGFFKIYKKAYYEFLGLSPNDLNVILDLLIGFKLIELIKQGNGITHTLTQYKFIDTYELEDSNSFQYQLDNPKTPLFLQRWFADGFKVKTKLETKFFKPAKQSSNRIKTFKNEDKSLQSIVDQQADKIAQLEAELTTLKTLMAATNQQASSLDKIDPVAANEVAEQVVQPTVATQYEFEIYNVKYVVEGWDLIMGGLKESNYKEYLEEEIADASESREEVLFSTTTKIIKRYDFNENIYNVQVVAA